MTSPFDYLQFADFWTTPESDHEWLSRYATLIYNGNLFAAKRKIEVKTLSGTPYDADGDLTGTDSDDIFWAGAAAQTINGGGGIDTVDYGSVEGTGVVVTLARGKAELGTVSDKLISIENVIGTAGDDTIRGNRKANILVGGDGNDKLYGGGGRDLLIGGSGNNELYGGRGFDFASYAEHTGSIKADLSVRRQHKVEQLDDAGTVTGTDKLAGIRGIIGTDGDDEIHGGRGRQIFLGGEGDDKLYGGGGRDQLYGCAGDDHLYGGNGRDRLFGGTGDDYLYGGRGRDWLYGGDGYNVLEGGAGADWLYGGTGEDTASYASATGRVKVDLDAGRGYWNHARGDRLESIENVLGSDYNDILIGDANSNKLWGGKGDDKLYGGAGDDFLAGGVGNDELTGGDGSDTFFFGLHAGDANSSATDIGNNTITDFKAGDILHFNLTGFSEFSQLEGLITTSGGNTVITFASGSGISGSITLSGFTGELTESDVLFG